jgi:type III secretion system low calcium response chaperone LcrH/SycD
MQNHNIDSRYQQLAQEFAQHLGLEPDSVESGFFAEAAGHGVEELYSYGYHLYQHRKYGSAASFFKIITALEPTNRAYWTSLGAVLKMQKEYRKAIEAYSTAVALDDSDPVSYFYLADCHLALGEVAEALGYVDAAERAATGKARYKSLISQLDLMRQAWCNYRLEDQISPIGANEPNKII